MNTVRFFKYVWQFLNIMHERVKTNLLTSNTLDLRCKPIDGCPYERNNDLKGPIKTVKVAEVTF